MNQSNTTPLFEGFINYILILLALALPIFFIPVTSEFYEFGKQLLLIGSALVLFVIWSLKMVSERKVKLVHSPIDLFMIIFFAAFGVATFLSTDQFASLFGPYPRFNNSLLSLAAVLIIYFVTVSNVKDKRQILNILGATVISASLASILAILNYANIYPFQTDWGKLRSFTPLGNFNNLAYFNLIVMPLALGLAVQAKNYLVRIGATVGAILIAAALVFINLTVAWIVLALIFLAFLLSLPKLGFDKKQQGLLVFTAVIFVLLLAVTNIKPLANNFLGPITAQENVSSLPKSVNLPPAVGWTTATGAIGSSALRAAFGLGPGTFLYSYTQFRPVSVNGSPLWDLRFDKSSSDFLEYLATIGVVGTLSYLLFMIVFGRFLLTDISKTSSFSDQHLPFFVGLAVLAFMIGSIFLNGSGSVYFVFFLTLALFFGLLSEKYPEKIYEIEMEIVALKSGALRFLPTPLNDRSERATNILPYVVLISTVVIAGLVGFVGFKSFKAEVFYRQAIVLTVGNKDAGAIRQALVNAVLANNYRDLYHRNLAATDIAIARAINQRQEKLTDQDKQLLQQLIIEAINQGKIITGYQNLPAAGTSAFNVANWETLSSVYASLIGGVKDINIHAVNSAVRVTQLDPYNVRGWVSLGQIFQSTGDLDAAIRAFETATGIKNDFADAHFNLASALKAKGGNDAKVVAELEVVLRILPQDSPQREQIQKQYDDLKAKLPPPTSQPAGPNPTNQNPPQTATKSATQSAQP